MSSIEQRENMDKILNNLFLSFPIVCIYFFMICQLNKVKNVFMIITDNICPKIIMCSFIYTINAAAENSNWLNKYKTQITSLCSSDNDAKNVDGDFNNFQFKPERQHFFTNDANLPYKNKKRIHKI
ncbi:Protein of unknown function [Gryllus bimaculatus]|nr:Protein of unknown function [Gryllus bimaculatus]